MGDQELAKRLMLMQDGQYREVGIPSFLFFKCDTCKTYKRAARLRKEVGKTGALEGKQIVIGYCTKCGNEVSASTNTEKERDTLAARSVYYWQKEQAAAAQKRIAIDSKGSKKKMPKDKTAKNAAKAAKTTAAKGKTKGVATTKGAAAAKTSSGERPRVWTRPDGAADGKTTLAMIMAGGPWTVAELRERHDKLAKTGKTSVRGRDLVTSDFSWMVNQEKIEIGEAEHQAYRGKNGDDEVVFTVPTLADPLVKGAKAGKVTNKNGKITFGGVTLTKDSGRAAPAAKATAAKKPAKASKK